MHQPHRLITGLFALLLVALATVTAQGSGKIERRSYWFEAAERDQDYALFVPKRVTEKAAAPLVVLLHGLGSNPDQVIRYQGITAEAAARGYIVVAPYGYNSRGWYGSRGKGKKGAFFGGKNDPDNLGELSEQDVMNVLAIVQKEHNVDPARIYLMGHSMGGAGTVHLGSTHPEIWAALAPFAPALDTRTSRLEKMKSLPVYMVTGDADRMVKVEIVRRWVDAMKKLEMDHVYVEIEGGDHVKAIARNAEMIAGAFDFFDKKRRAAASDVKAAGQRDEKGKE